MFYLPKKFRNEIEYIIMKVLWNGKGEGRTHYKVAWDTCCLYSSEGCLGLKNLMIWVEFRQAN